MKAISRMPSEHRPNVLPIRKEQPGMSPTAPSYAPCR